MSQNTTPPTTNGAAGTDPQAAARAATNEAAGTSVEASRSTGADILDWPQWIDGERVDSVSGQWRDVTNPALRESVIARVPASTVDDVERVVGAARRAFGGWAAQHFTRRARPLALIADDIEAETEEFARLTALDTGNAIRTQARPEVASLVSLFRYFSGVAGESKGTTLPAGDDQLQYTRREPLGVVAAILKLAEVCNRHLPAGVLNALTGRGAVIGDALAKHPGVDKVSFTGSTEVGRGVAAQAGERLAHMSMELGGKNPSIVFPDAVDDQLVDQLLLASRFARQGQSCTAGSRLFIHREVYDEVLSELVPRLGAMKVGDPLEEASDMGAVINAKQHAGITGYLDEGRSMGGLETLLGGSAPTEGELTRGFYHVPTVFGGGRNDFRLAREEIFGPVLMAIPFDTREEVIEMANDTHFGLAAYVFSHDLDRALDTAHSLQAGWVQVNQGGGQVVGQTYGGYKQSGMGREVSLEGMLEGFTQTKQINVKLRPSSTRS
ncbi:MAG: aldehyde dehydrogenase family protein [Micrococcaceae bacterium]|nr:aldehyde dehydrogenase family protein [Micrococcaceae bacterium]